MDPLLTDDADPVLALPVLVLGRSRAVRMRTARRNGIPGGVRMMAAGVAIDGEDNALAFVAYGNDAAALEPPAWPAQSAPRPLELLFPGSVEVVAAYRGKDVRRAAGIANARLAKAGARPADLVATPALESTWRTVSQMRAADRYRRMRRLFEHVSLGGALDG